MTTKRMVHHKNVRQKKVLSMAAASVAKTKSPSEEEAIKRQLSVIKKDYDKLMIDVAAGYGLIKDWVGVQAVSKGQMLKSRLTKT